MHCEQKNKLFYRSVLVPKSNGLGLVVIDFSTRAAVSGDVVASVSSRFTPACLLDTPMLELALADAMGADAAAAAEELEL